MFNALARLSNKHGWNRHQHLPWAIWLFISFPKVVRNQWAGWEWKTELVAAWRNRAWCGFKEHIAIEIGITISGIASAGIGAMLTQDDIGLAIALALLGGLLALLGVCLIQIIVAVFSVSRSANYVSMRANERLVGLIRNIHLYLEDTRRDPNHSRQMYEQYQSYGESYANEIDRFSARYYPNEQTQLSKLFINLYAPSFDNKDARAKYIDHVNSIVKKGMLHLEKIKMSKRQPKPTPFDRAA